MLQIHGAESTRLEQLQQLSTLELQGIPLAIHGSIGHSVMMGEQLPSHLKVDDEPRDVDVFAFGMNKWIIERELLERGLANPSPVDAGLSQLIKKENGHFTLSRGKVEVPLEDAYILEDYQAYTVPNSGGIKVRALRPEGMMAIHGIDPRNGLIRSDHIAEDTAVMKWFYDHKVTLPKRFQESIDTFHRLYHEAYPHHSLFWGLRNAYHHVTPKLLRNTLKPLAHAIRTRYVGEK